MKKLMRLSILSLLIFLSVEQGGTAPKGSSTLFFETTVYTNRWFTKMANGSERNSILTPPLRLADSLLGAGNDRAAISLYLGALDSCEEFSAIELYLLKKVGDTYLKNKEYGTAFDFFRKYEWSASQQITYGKGFMPDDGIVWCDDGGENWGPLMKELKSLEIEIGKFGRYLDKFESQYFSGANYAVEKRAQVFAETYITKAYSLNYRLWSESLKTIYLANGNMDSLRIERMAQGWGPDSAKIDGVSFITPDRAKVFVKEFGSTEGSELPFSRVSPTIIEYNFIKELNLWKFNGFKY